MAKAKKLPSGNYEVRAYNKYTKKQKAFVASTAKEAKFLANQYLMSISPESKDDCTVKEAIRMYIDNRSSVLSPSTVRGYEVMLNNNYEKIGNYSVDRISSEVVQRFINDMSRSKSPKSVRNIYGLLISSIKAVRPTKILSITLPTKKPIERNIPTDNDIQELLNRADAELRKAILLSSIGTLRRGEICGLKYEDIKGNIIHVHADIIMSPSREWVYKDVPKNSSSDRYIEFPAEVIQELGQGSGFIIKITPNGLSNKFIKLRDKIGIKCRFHDLRIYAASIMHAIGVPDVYIMERGGWKSDTILKDVYRNVLSDKSKEFSDRMNNYMSKFF